MTVAQVNEVNISWPQSTCAQGIDEKLAGYTVPQSKRTRDFPEVTRTIEETPKKPP